MDWIGVNILLRMWLYSSDLVKELDHWLACIIKRTWNEWKGMGTLFKKIWTINRWILERNFMFRVGIRSYIELNR